MLDNGDPSRECDGRCTKRGKCSDSDTIGRAVAGDGEALAELLKQHTPALRHHLDRMIPVRWRSLLSAQDLLQETYTDAFLGIKHFTSRQERVFAVWLRTIGTRNTINAIKLLEAEKRGRHCRQVRLPSEDSSCAALLDLLSCSGSTPSRHVTRREEYEALDRAMRRLPEHYRLVVALYDLEGLEMREVACVLKRSVQASHSLRFRAHQLLRMLLGHSSRLMLSV